MEHGGIGGAHVDDEGIGRPHVDDEGIGGPHVDEGRIGGRHEEAEIAGSLADGNREPSVLPLATRWSVDLGGQPVARAAPVMDDKRVYVALGTGQIVARNLSDGVELWQKDLPTEQPIATDSGLLFVTSRDAIYALRAADGARIWEKPAAGITAPLVARSGWLIVIAERRLLAFRSKDGELIWQTDVGRSTVPPAIDGDRLYVSLDEARIVAIDITTGKTIWDSPIGATPGPPFAAGDRVYAGAGDRKFYCLNARNGEVAWVKWIGAAVLGSAAVDTAHVYVMALNNLLYALDRSNGNQRWQHASRRRAVAGPEIGGKYVFVASSSAPEIWIWMSDGRPAGTLTLPAEPVVPPAVAERGTATLDVVAVTGNLSSQWQLTLLTKADEPSLVPFTELPGSAIPVRELPAEPPLVPLTVLPGIVLKPERQ